MVRNGTIKKMIILRKTIMMRDNCQAHKFGHYHASITTGICVWECKGEGSFSNMNREWEW